MPINENDILREISQDPIDLIFKVLRDLSAPEEFRILFTPTRKLIETKYSVDIHASKSNIPISIYLDFRRDVILSFRNVLRSRALDLRSIICFDLEYCNNLYATVGQIGSSIANSLGSRGLPDEIASAISILSLTLQQLNIFCACDGYDAPPGA